MASPLTPRQRQVLMAELGIRSPNGITCHLRQLSRKGYVLLPDRVIHGVRLAGARAVLEYTADAAGARLREALREPDPKEQSP